MTGDTFELPSFLRALLLLRPVLVALEHGAIDPYSEDAVRAAVGQLRSLPSLTDLIGLHDFLCCALGEPTESAPSGETADHLIAVAVAAHAATTTIEAGELALRMRRLLTHMLMRRFQLRRDAADLDFTIRLLNGGLGLTAHDRALHADYVLRLAVAHAERAGLARDATDLDESIKYFELVLGNPDDTRAGAAEVRAMRLNALARALSQRFDMRGTRDDLDRSIALCEEAYKLSSPGGKVRVAVANDLAIDLRMRFEQDHLAEDLQRRVALWEEALAATPDGSGEWARYASSLAGALRERLEHEGTTPDLDRSLDLAAKALSASRNTAYEPMALNALSAGLLLKYETWRNPDDLERSVATGEAAVAATDRSDSGWAPRANNLANALAVRFDLRKNEVDLDRYIALDRELVDLTPEDSPDLPSRLSNLASALRVRYGIRKSDADLEDCIAALIKALRRTPRRGTAHAVLLYNLAGALADRFDAHGRPDDLDRSLSLYERSLRRARPTVAPFVCADLARRLIICMADAAATADNMAEVRVLERLAAIVPIGAAGYERQLVTLGSDRERDELHFADRFGGLYDLQIRTRLRLAELLANSAPDGAARHRRDAFVTAERAKGRRAAALMASRPAPPRIDLSNADELERLRLQLVALESAVGRGDVRERARRNPTSRGGIASLHGGAVDRSSLALDELPRLPPDVLEYAARSGAGRDRLVERVEVTWRRFRQVLGRLAVSDPEYALQRGFAEPHGVEEIARKLPAGGAMLLLYPLGDELVCLVVHHGSADVAAATLPGLGGETLEKWVQSSFHSSGGAIPEQRMLNQLLKNLASTLGPVLKDLLPLGNTDRAPSLIVVPTGALHRLPLHAMPFPTSGDPTATLLDSYTVSYASTADVYLLALDRPAAGSGFVALAPGLPAGGWTPLGTVALAQALARCSGGQALVGKEASIDAALAGALGGRQLVVLATHGDPGGWDQSRSGLQLHSGRGDVPAWLTAAEITVRLKLDGVEHLFLLACSTHADDPVPGDRLAGLITAFLYRGARSVQATLWPVREDAALPVGWWVAQAILAGERDKAAALRRAVLRLRNATGAEIGEALEALVTMAEPSRDVQQHVEEQVRYLENIDRPFRETLDWAPFVLHGAPLV